MATFQYNAVVQNIRNQLAITLPELNTEYGTLARKLIEVIADRIVYHSADESVLFTTFDMAAYSGTQLDWLFSLFGFTRQVAKAAGGVVTFRRDDADSYEFIPFGTNFYTAGGVEFRSVPDVWLQEGQTTIKIPVQCSQTGSVGNIAAYAIVTDNMGIVGESTNHHAFVGGMDYEDDETFRQRFFNTAFKNCAGTLDQYAGIANSFSSIRTSRLFGRTNYHVEFVTTRDDGTGRIVGRTWNKDIRDVNKLNHVTVIPGNPSAIPPIPDETVQWDEPTNIWVSSISEAYRYVKNDDFRAQIVWKTVGGLQVIDYMEIEFIPLQINESDIVLDSGQTTFDLNYENVLPDTPSTPIKVFRNDGFDGNGDTILTPVDFTISGNTVTLLQAPTASAFYTATYFATRVPAGDIISIEYDYMSHMVNDRSWSFDIDAVLLIDSVETEVATDTRIANMLMTLRVVDNGVVNNRDKWDIVGHYPDHLQPALYNPVFIFQNTPIVDCAETITWGENYTTLTRGEDFWLLRDNDVAAGSIYAQDAIEINADAAKNSLIAAGNMQNYNLQVNYLFDPVVAQCQQAVDDQSPVGTNTLVKRAKRRFFGFDINVITTTYTRADLQALVDETIANEFANYPIGEPIRLSAIQNVIQNVFGIQAVKITRVNEYFENSDTVKSSDPIIGSTGCQCPRDVLLNVDEIAYYKFSKVTSKTDDSWSE